MLEFFTAAKGKLNIFCTNPNRIRHLILHIIKSEVNMWCLDFILKSQILLWKYFLVLIVMIQWYFAATQSKIGKWWQPWLPWLKSPLSRHNPLRHFLNSWLVCLQLSSNHPLHWLYFTRKYLGSIKNTKKITNLWRNMQTNIEEYLEYAPNTPNKML